MKTDRSKTELKLFFDEIHEIGKCLDLTECVYGLFHDNKTLLGTSSYYYFLAGLTKKITASKIVEIGTYRGGSTKAFAAGIASVNGRGKILTFDIKDFDPDFSIFESYITRHVDNPITTTSIEKAFQVFDGSKNIDILFVDGSHDMHSTLLQTLIYDKLFTPSWIIWDDININESMREFHDLAKIIYPDFVDISQICPQIRRCSEGFGVFHRNKTNE